MVTKRNKKELSVGTTSRAYAATKYSLLSYRPYSRQLNGQMTEWELLYRWERRLKITRKNTLHMLEARRRWLCLTKFRHEYYVSPRPECAESIIDYILYERQNHPAKKGKGRLLTGKEELDAVNAVLYPDGLNIFPVDDTTLNEDELLALADEFDMDDGFFL